VNTQGIRNNNDTWAQFMKLTQEARSRNQGIAAVPVKNSVNRVNTAKVLSQINQNPATSFVNKSSFISDKPAVKTKIVGGLVDTYA
jgi:hypothetical protein